MTAQELSIRISMPAILPTRHVVPNIAVSSPQPVVSASPLVYQRGP
jgi:hypothetical protein